MNFMRLTYSRVAFAVIIAAVGFSFGFAPFISANGELTLEGGDSFTSSVGVALPITDLQIAGPAASTTPINLVVTSGTLSITNTGGLTFNTALSGTTINFEGTVANINTALETLTYTRGGTGSDTLEVTLVNEGEVFFPETGNLYEYIADSGTWDAAKTKAEAQTRYGVSGYLVTIMSQAENDFVAERLQDAGWMGASDSASEGIWRWVTGPQTNVHFWTGTSGGSVQNGNYANWSIGEPNDSGGTEDCAQFLAGGSGKWNDLPCSGTTLPGYVAEFGSNDGGVEIASKNITLTTVSSPTLTSFSPADNATGVVVDGELIIEFSASMATGTGSLVIYDYEDTVIETISATSSQIVIAGDTVTISLSEDFAESTSYYIEIDNTLFTNLSAVAYAGINNTTTWNFTTGDFTNPVISNVMVDFSTSTAAITWTTDELASSRVVYGLTSSYGTTTAESNTSPRVLSHEVALEGLLPCTIYYYQAVSRDASNNAASQGENTFTTTGCPASGAPVSATTTSITSLSGGSTTLSEGSSSITVTAPSDFTSTSSSVVIQVLALTSSAILAELGVPRPLPESVGNIVFDVKAIINGDTVLDSFDSPVTITYVYNDEDIVGMRESSLWLYHYHDGSWDALDDCSLDMGTNTISCTTPNFSIFSLFGAEEKKGSSIGTITGCGDVKASNYNPKVRHNERFCKYEATSPTSSPLTTNGSFIRDLTVGSIGEDVRRLQQLLNSTNFPVALSGVGSSGSESDYFGSYTQSALAKFQSANGIAPAVGYFGPITRARFNISMTTSSTTTKTEVNYTIPVVVTETSPAVDEVATLSGTFTRDLTGGTSGDDVKMLQEFLISAGYQLSSGATGYFGSETRSALTAFQVDKGINPAQGYFGARTRALIQ